MSEMQTQQLEQCPRCLRNRIDPAVEKICGDCVIAERDEDEKPASTSGEAQQQLPTPASGKSKPGQPTAGKRPGAPAATPAPNGTQQKAATPAPAPQKAATPAARPAPTPTATQASRAIGSGKQTQTAARPVVPAPVIIVGVQEEPIKMGFYGPGNVGKTSLLASIPDVFIAQLESSPFLDVARSPVNTFAEYQGVYRFLRYGEHNYKAFGIDSADVLEKLVVKAVIQRSNERHDQQQDAEHIEHVGGGYKKGFTAARARFYEVLQDLEQLRLQRGMHIFFTAHDIKVKVTKPDIEASFERYDLALHEEIGREEIFNWVDSWLLCNFVTRVKKVGKRGNVFRGVGGKERAIYTTNNDAYRAKNRFDLPERLPYEPGRGWEVIAAAIELWKSPKLLHQAIDDALAYLGDLTVDVRGQSYYIKDLVVQELAGNPSRQRLAQLKNRLEARVIELEEKREEEAAAAGERGGNEQPAPPAEGGGE